MLDQLSDGRLQLGVGAGVSPIEVGFFGVDWDSRRERFDETFEILLKGLATDELTHHGPEHRYDAVPIVLSPSSARTRRSGSASRGPSAPTGPPTTR